MADKELQLQVENLKLVIDVEEENYKTAIQQQLPHEILIQMRANIKKLKSDLQILVDKESVGRTGELPEGGVA